MGKRKVYLVCDWSDSRARSDNGTPNCGVEFLGNCRGRALEEDGTVIGQHYSSTLGWLRSDLKCKVKDLAEVEFVDLLSEPVPERFKLAEESDS